MNREEKKTVVYPMTEGKKKIISNIVRLMVEQQRFVI
jgi:F0F1-type ATP synthase delta subunit